MPVRIHLTAVTYHLEFAGIHAFVVGFHGGFPFPVLTLRFVFTRSFTEDAKVWGNNTVKTDFRAHVKRSHNAPDVGFDGKPGPLPPRA